MNRRERRAQESWARKDRRLQGMEIRYDGRTLSFDVLVNTDEDPEAVAWRIRQKAPGPKQVMTMVAARKPGDSAITAPLWETEGIPTYFDGRTLTFQVLLNTDEDAEAVSERILSAARAPGNQATEATLRALCSVPASEPVSLAVVLAGGDVPPETARPMWEATFRASLDAVEREN